MSCYDEREHRRQAEDDFRFRGRYGYDRDLYDPYADYDSCARAYTEEFDREVRQADRRREERLAEEEHAAERARIARRELEEMEFPSEPEPR